MEKERLKIGDTLVFDHSDYTDYCIVYAVNEEGSKGKMACVDDGAGTDCLWLMPVRCDSEGNLTTYQNRKVERDPTLLERATGWCNEGPGFDEEGQHWTFEDLLVHLLGLAEQASDHVTYFFDTEYENKDGFNREEELAELRAAITKLKGIERFCWLLNEQGDKADVGMAEAVRREKVEQVLHQFDFSSLHEKMKKLDLQWESNCFGKGVPSVYQLVKKAKELLNSCVIEADTFNTCRSKAYEGLCAEAWPKGELSLTFVIEEASHLPI